MTSHSDQMGMGSYKSKWHREIPELCKLRLPPQQPHTESQHTPTASSIAAIFEELEAPQGAVIEIIGSR